MPMATASWDESASPWLRVGKLPLPTNPNYQALKLYTNYDGAHHGFGTTSVSATHNANPSLFSTYAALNSTGTSLTIMVLNKDPANSAQVQFTTTGFTPTNVTTYTLVAIVTYDHCGVVLAAVVCDPDVCSIYRYFAGRQRQYGQHSRLRVGLESGHDHGGGGRNGYPSTEDH